MQQFYSTEIAPCRCAKPRNTPRRAHKRCFYEVKRHLVAFFSRSCLVWYCGRLKLSVQVARDYWNGPIRTQQTQTSLIIRKPGKYKCDSAFVNRAVESYFHWLKGILKLFEHNVKFKFTLARYTLYTNSIVTSIYKYRGKSYIWGTVLPRQY